MVDRALCAKQKYLYLKIKYIWRHEIRYVYLLIYLILSTPGSLERVFVSSYGGENGRFW